MHATHVSESVFESEPQQEAACVAEFKAERSMLKRRQVLEEQKFRLKLEESRLNLEAEIAKTMARKLLHEPHHQQTLTAW